MYLFSLPPFEKVICFIHNPKTGGTSIVKKLQDELKYSNRDTIRNILKPMSTRAGQGEIRQMTYTGNIDTLHMAPHRSLTEYIDYLTTHGATLEVIQDKIVFLTVVRNPIERALSWARHHTWKRIQSTGGDPARSKKLLLEQLDNFISGNLPQELFFKSEKYKFEINRENILIHENLAEDFSRFIVRNSTLTEKDIGQLPRENKAQIPFTRRDLNDSQIKSFNSARYAIEKFDKTVRKLFGYPKISNVI